MVPVHPGRILRDELRSRTLAANGLARALRVPSGRIVDILNGKRAISAETALRLVLLHHKFARRAFPSIGAAQHGHRERVATSAAIKRRRMVATEFGM